MMNILTLLKRVYAGTKTHYLRFGTVLDVNKYGF
jgi:hypothetical protein